MEPDLRSLPDYCEDWNNRKRFETRVVMVGDVAIGGSHPIRVQSMTTTDTMDTQATIEQSIRMIDAGCELVRITAPSKKEAENLANIKQGLVDRGYNTPLVADIHFTPNAAEIAAKIVEKVRVNPGNYADKKKFQELEYTEESYQAELDRIRDRFIPLVKICKEHGTAMRIGTNHGSLSDRIMSRYGDTPYGMVESALEFVRICVEQDYHNLILSMKASNTQVMVQAYRLLVSRMQEEGMNYPLHLGVTEAGEGEDGRIKSAVGIGTLLQDGLGDTIRVSLTEEPEAEIPVAQELITALNRGGAQSSRFTDQPAYSPFEFVKKYNEQVKNIGGSEVPRVIADLSKKKEIKPASLFPLGLKYSVPLDKWNLSDLAADFIYIGDKKLNFGLPGTVSVIQDVSAYEGAAQHYPLMSLEAFTASGGVNDELNFVSVDVANTDPSACKSASNVVWLLKHASPQGITEVRGFINQLLKQGNTSPILLARDYSELNADQMQLASASEFGSLLLDGFLDGIMLSASEPNIGVANNTSFGILQACRARISKTEYISCPSCGRTLFDLQETTAKIRNRTDHLKGVKIGIMGCIVNGPGEMADADYGYVGTGPGKITLYKEKEVVKRNVPSEHAVDELINLIKDHGDWIEKD